MKLWTKLGKKTKNRTYMHRQLLLSLLENHQPFDKNEEAMLQQTIDFVRQNPQCFERSLAIGHITGSAWIVDESRDYAILMHHKKLNRWFQPGGHADGETNVLNVAIKEAQEETGVVDLKILSHAIYDVDVHLIPENPKELAHYHFDIRFLFEVKKDIPLKINAESKEIKWVKHVQIPNFNNSESILRMIRKL